jgi:hypothetical protein
MDFKQLSRLKFQQQINHCDVTQKIGQIKLWSQQKLKIAIPVN